MGSDQPQLVVHLQNLPKSYAASGKHDRCEPLPQHSLKLVTSALGPNSPQLSIPLECWLQHCTIWIGMMRQSPLLAKLWNFVNVHLVPIVLLLVRSLCLVLPWLESTLVGVNVNLENVCSEVIAWQIFTALN